MSEYTIDVVKSDVTALGKNVMKIRKYIRDHQAQLQQFSTNMLNQALRDVIPSSMILKRNYGVLSLRAGGKTEAEPVVEKKSKKKKVVVEYSSESESDDEDVEVVQKRPSRRPEDVPRDVRPSKHHKEQVDTYPEEQAEIPHYCLSNEDLARNCFMEVAQRKWRKFM